MVKHDPETIRRLLKDEVDAMKLMGRDEVRFLVDAYYMVQDSRMRSSHQDRTLVDNEEPHSVIEWLEDMNRLLESQLKRALDRFSTDHFQGGWLRSVVGVGPVIAAGLIAHIDIKKCPTVGHIWRFAGLDPTMEWLGNKKSDALIKEVAPGTGKVTPAQMAELSVRTNRRPSWVQDVVADGARNKVKAALAKRPWNAKLKMLCAYKLGESFVKQQNHVDKETGESDCVYGRLYVERKVLYTARNEAGDYEGRCKERLKNDKVKKATELYKHMVKGVLPPAAIHAMARRYAVKIFLSHLHQVWYEQEYKKPAPVPFPIAIQGHTHMIDVPQVG